MNNDNKNIFTIVSDKNEKIECEVIMTIYCEEYKKNFMIYTDHTKDELGNTRTFACSYDPTGEDLTLKPVIKEDEWKIVENALASAQKKIFEEAKNAESE